MKNTYKYLRIITLLMLFILCNSCIIFNPEKFKLTDNTNLTTSTGIKITINEIPKLLGSNSTTIELYENSNNQLTSNVLIKKLEFKWNSINDIKLENGVYKLITYYLYFGKDRLKTETIVNVNNTMTNIVIEYPLFITGKAKLKVY